MYNTSILTVVGTHAGETIEEIFSRKQKEITKLGYTLWLYKSHSAKPPIIQQLPKQDKIYVYFIEASSPSGAKPTTQQNVATIFSLNQQDWGSIPSEMIVTGSSGGAFALVLKNIELLKKESLDLWDYSDYKNSNNPVKIRLGDSTIPVVNVKSISSPNKMNSHIRKVVAKAELEKPFCVYVK